MNEYKITLYFTDGSTYSFKERFPSLRDAQIFFGLKGQKAELNVKTPKADFLLFEKRLSVHSVTVEGRE